jgi:hypothetical protein
MRRLSKPLPKDPNQLAYKIVQLSTEEPKQPKEKSEISKYLSEIGKRGGLRAGWQGQRSYLPKDAKRLPKKLQRQDGAKNPKGNEGNRIG